jgi:hypothetical protein
VGVRGIIAKRLADGVVRHHRECPHSWHLVEHQQAAVEDQRAAGGVVERA